MRTTASQIGLSVEVGCKPPDAPEDDDVLVAAVSAFPTAGFSRFRKAVAAGRVVGKEVRVAAVSAFLTAGFSRFRNAVAAGRVVGKEVRVAAVSAFLTAGISRFRKAVAAGRVVGKEVRVAAVSAFLTAGIDVWSWTMSNVHRLRTTDRIFFVTVNLSRQAAPLQASEYQKMLDVFRRSRRRLPFLLCGYVLMPDHWHALIWTGCPLTISQVIHDLKKVSAHRLHEQRGTKGPVWQRQFWDRFVRNASEFNKRLDYMHLNPVCRGLVAKPEEWRWSSYNNFALDKATVAGCPIEIDYVRLPEGYRA